MKKITAVIVSVLIMLPMFFMLTASAWDTPELSLQATYNEKKQTLTVKYRILKLAGTESADFRLKYNTDILEYEDGMDEKIGNNILVEVGNQSDGLVAIQFVNLYHVEESDCEEDGSAVIATITFKVRGKSASDAVLIATADSCAMDPNSESVFIERSTLKVPLQNGNVTVSTHEQYASESSSDSVSDGKSSDNANVKKIVIACVVSAVIFVVLLAAIVVKYRKNDNEEKTEEKIQSK